MLSVELTGKVTEIQSGTKFDDKVQRVSIELDNPVSVLNSKLTLRNIVGFVLDQTVTITIAARVQPREEVER